MASTSPSTPQDVMVECSEAGMDPPAACHVPCRQIRQETTQTCHGRLLCTVVVACTDHGSDGVSAQEVHQVPEAPTMGRLPVRATMLQASALSKHAHHAGNISRGTVGRVSGVFVCAHVGSNLQASVDILLRLPVAVSIWTPSSLMWPLSYISYITVGALPCCLSGCRSVLLGI